MIHLLEHSLLEFLAQYIGMKNALRLEDLTMTLLALLSGYMIGQLRAVRLFRENFRINDKMKHLIFQRNEHNGVVEYDFKRPRTFMQSIEALIGMHLAGKRYSKLELSKARGYAAIILTFSFLIIASLVIAIGFALNISDFVVVK